MVTSIEGQFNRPKLTPADLEVGSILVTPGEGRAPERAVLEGVEGGRVSLRNLDDGRPFITNLNRLKSGRVGRSRIIGTERFNAEGNNEGQKEEIRQAVGTERFYVIPKEGDQTPVPAVLARVHGDTVVLTTPGEKQHQIFRADKNTVLAGGDEKVEVVPIPDKFSMIFATDEEDEQRKRIAEEAMIRIEDGKRPLDINSLPVEPVNPEPVSLKPLADIRNNPVFPGDVVYLMSKDVRTGELRTSEALYVGVVPKERSAKFVVAVAEKDGGGASMTLKVPLEGMLRGQRRVALLSVPSKGVEITREDRYIIDTVASV